MCKSVCKCVRSCVCAAQQQELSHLRRTPRAHRGMRNTVRLRHISGQCGGLLCRACSSRPAHAPHTHACMQ